MNSRNSLWEKSRKLNWLTFDQTFFPSIPSGAEKLKVDWSQWEEPFKTSYFQYIKIQHSKELAVEGVRNAMQRINSSKQLSRQWLSTLKLHGALLPLAEFAAVIGNLRAARFAPDSAWRITAMFAALDELRHTQIPLRIFQHLVSKDSQFDWVHKFYHSNNWVAIAARHVFDEMLLAANPLEFAIATNFVFETGFTNLQFIGLSALAAETGDAMFEDMVSSMQTDEARHAQIGSAVIDLLDKDLPYVQKMVDKWFWRSWRLFAIATGFSIDYFTPVEHRKISFREFMEEWVLIQFQETLKQYGLKLPWYWELFLEELDYYHHMVYASAYSYRATTWFDFYLPGPQDEEWFMEKYPKSWPPFKPIWQQIRTQWEKADPNYDLGVHSSSIIGFCYLCQVILASGTPFKNNAIVEQTAGIGRVFCSEPCQKLFHDEPERYKNHLDIVNRVLIGEAPGNLMAMLTQYMGLNFDTWGKDSFQGVYPWVKRG